MSADSDSDSSDESGDGDWIAMLEESDVESEDGQQIVVNFKGLQKILARSHPQVGERLSDVMKEIDDRTPTFLKIMSEDLELEHRVQLVELFEALKELESACLSGTPCRLEYISLRNQIHQLTKKYKRKKAARDRLSESVRQEDDRVREALCDETREEADTIEERILRLQASRETKSVIYRRYKRMEGLGPTDDERAKLTTWLGWALRMPYDREVRPAASSPPATLLRLAKALDDELYGMRAVKQQILTFVSTRVCRRASGRGDILALVGPPGTGKTSIARLLRTALEIPLAQISFGGVTNPEFFTGHDYTYVGSRPGEIARALARLGCRNGIVFMDEFEKVAANKSTVASLLHIIDKQQNSAFRDHYLRDVTLDLSQIWFVCSMNDLPQDSALTDRLFVVKVEGYDRSAKREILVRHIVPSAVLDLGLSPGSVTLTQAAQEALIAKVSPETSGVRSLESSVREIVRKLSFLESVGESIGEYPFPIDFDLKRCVSFPTEVSDRDLSVLLRSPTGPSHSHLAMYT